MFRLLGNARFVAFVVGVALASGSLAAWLVSAGASESVIWQSLSHSVQRQVKLDRGAVWLQQRAVDQIAIKSVSLSARYYGYEKSEEDLVSAGRLNAVREPNIFLKPVWSSSFHVRGIHGSVIRLPLWVPLVIGVCMMVPAILRLLAVIQFAARCLCPKCGFDWRATPLACSECGFGVDRKTNTES